MKWNVVWKKYRHYFQPLRIAINFNHCTWIYPIFQINLLETNIYIYIRIISIECKYIYIHLARQSQKITSTRDKTRETKPAQDGNVESYHSSSPARDPDRECWKAVKRKKRGRSGGGRDAEEIDHRRWEMSRGHVRG